MIVTYFQRGVAMLNLLDALIDTMQFANQPKEDCPLRMALILTHAFAGVTSPEVVKAIRIVADKVLPNIMSKDASMGNMVYKAFGNIGIAIGVYTSLILIQKKDKEANREGWMCLATAVIAAPLNIQLITQLVHRFIKILPLASRESSRD